jgi:hydroxypyruvate isomerase
MLKISACIEMLFTEYDFYDRISAAKKVGLDGIEFWGWTNKDIKRIDELKDELDIVITGCTVGSNDQVVAETWGKCGLLYPEYHEQFLKALEETTKVANNLDIPNIIVTVGQERHDVNRELQHESIVSALKKAAPIVEDQGITLVVEPLNILVNHKGYFLYSSAEGFDIINEVASPNIKLLYDVYHQQITEGNLIETIRNNIDLIGHFHIADVPGRNEPGTGEICYENVLKTIGGLGYQGYIGLEYQPVARTEETVRRILKML